MILGKDTIDRYDEWFAGIPEHGGTALIDKEQHWTSFDVVAKLRGLTRIKKVGHAGTLDPLATGLLIVCFGKATKLIDRFQEQTKVYQAVVKLGAVTKTDDAEAEEEQQRDYAHLQPDEIRQAAAAFTGTIKQIPPMFSAIKKGGVPLYKMARRGQSIEREPRTVHIERIEVSDISLPYVHLDVTCSKGTYIRSLARDIGERLGCGGYLASLRRTAIGEMQADNALSIAEFQQAARPQTV